MPQRKKTGGREKGTPNRITKEISHGGIKVNISGNILYFQPDGGNSPMQLSSPIFPSGTEIITDDLLIYFYADNRTDIQPVIFTLHENLGIEYTIPDGKKLVLKSVSQLDAGQSLWLDDELALRYTGAQYFPIFPPKITLSIKGTGNIYVGVTGYLIDN